MTYAKQKMAAFMNIYIGASIFNLRRPGLTLVGLCCLLIANTQFGQPSVHYFYDAVGIRDAATVLYGLDWSLASVGRSLRDAVYLSLEHIEGPAQFLLLNFNAMLAGQIATLDPAIMALPNALLACLALFLFRKTGEKLVSQGAGLVIALMFASQPWLWVVARMPWYFNVLTPLLEISTIFFLARHLLEPRSLRFKIAFPALLALYLLASLSWQPFFAFLFVWLVISKRLSQVLRNPYMLLPLISVLIWGLQIARLLHYENFDGAKTTLLTYAFFKAANNLGLSAERIYTMTFFGIGIGIFASLAAGMSLFSHRSVFMATLNAEVLGKNLLAACFFWLLLSGIPFFASSTSIHYGYVVSVPLAILAGAFISRLRPIIAVTAIVLCLAWTAVAAFSYVSFVNAGDDDRRVIAVAAYLNTKRPDLLDSSKTAFLPRPLASNVGQYARGLNDRIILPSNFLSLDKVTSVASPEHILRNFVSSYRERGALLADWLVLTPELSATGRPEIDGFFLSMRNNPEIAWIARFRDDRGREVWLGERAMVSSPLEQAPVIDVEAYAEIYARDFDRIDFLSRNVHRIFHY